VEEAGEERDNPKELVAAYGQWLRGVRWDIEIHNIIRKHVGKHGGGILEIGVPKIHPLLANACAPALSIICPNLGTHQYHRYTQNRHGYCPLHVVTSPW
jgi:hypothetical protein